MSVENTRTVCRQNVFYISLKGCGNAGNFYIMKQHNSAFSVAIHGINTHKFMVCEKLDNGEETVLRADCIQMVQEISDEAVERHNKNRKSNGFIITD